MKRALLVCLFLVLPSMAHAAIAKVSTHDCGSVLVGATTNCTITGVTAGNTIIVGAHSGAGAIVSVTDASGDTYAAVPGNTTGIGVYKANNVTGGSTTVTVTCTGTTGFCGLLAAEFSGGGGVPLFDGNGINSAFATGQTTILTGLKTPSTTTSTLIFCFGVVDSVQTPSALTNYGAGNASFSAFTNGAQTATGGGETLRGAWGLSTSAVTNGCRWTITSASSFGAAAAVLGTPTLVGQCDCPNGSGITGVCECGATTVSNLLKYFIVPPGTNETAAVYDAATVCSPGTAPVGGGSFFCTVGWNGSTWLEN